MSDVLKIYNPTTGGKVDFVPISTESIGVYGCGPTVYNKPHIGNIRSMLSYDILVRTLRAIYPKVVFVRNITDVDDKIVDAAMKEGLSTLEISEKYLTMFHHDMASLGCIEPTIEPRVSNYIGDIIHIIERLLNNGHAYIAADGVYFKVGSFPEYGQLSRRKLDTQIAGARVAAGEHKHDAADFALWKLYPEETITWPSPWGNGRPGWHIECSAMSYKELGADFDIHCGGEDLKFPHHENEIAQSRCAFHGSSFARYWIHTAFVMFGSDKMSKSLGNVCYLGDIITQRINAEVVRYGLLATHYRKPINISASLFSSAREALDRIYDSLLKHRHIDPVTSEEECALPDDAFKQAILDDLNIPMALSELHRMVTEINSSKDNSHKALIMRTMVRSARFLGLLSKTPEQWFNIDTQDARIMELINMRNAARREKNFAQADRLRLELKNMGVALMDNEDGTCTWTRQDIEE